MIGVLAARLLVRLRFVIALMWLAGAAWAVVALPSVGASGGGGLASLVPKDAQALQAERASAREFAFPLLSRVIVVVRDPHGLPRGQQAQIIRLAAEISLKRRPDLLPIAGALPLIDVVGPTPLSRERDTTALLYLYFRPSVSTYDRDRAAHRLLRQIPLAPGEFAGVTGEAPAQVAQTRLIQGTLQWVELATILLVAVAIAVRFRAPGAALLTILAVAVAYLLADHVVAELGQALGVTVPAEVGPVLVVLVFGVVTDYSVFFLSRFRELLAQTDRRQAAVRTIREIAPIVAAAGITVAAGTAALLVAHLDFLRAFGPGLAAAVIIAMVVAVGFVPPLLAIAGPLVFWPRQPRRGDVPPVPPEPMAPSEPPKGSRRPRLRVSPLGLAARWPLAGIAVALAVVGAGATGLRHLSLGNELIQGLPASNPVHRAYTEADQGFAPGVVSPAVVVVQGSGLARQRPALARLQLLLAHQPGIAAALGPRDQPLPYHFGAALAKAGNAARYVLFLRSPPLGARAIAQIRTLIRRLPQLLRAAGLRHARGLVGGDTALSSDTVNDTVADLGRVAPTVLLAIFVVIALFLRALVAPLYLVLTSVLAPLASLGLTVYVMQDLLGFPEITYYVIFVVAVLLISLGSDYNVFLIGEIWQEGRRRKLRQAIRVAGRRASRAITTAGFVLALSFALLAIVPVRAFREIALAMAIGLLIDALVVRTILVPALVSLVGPRSAWPGHRLPPGGDPH